MHTYIVPGTPLVLPFHEELRPNCRIDIRGEVCSPERSWDENRYKMIDNAVSFTRWIVAHSDCLIMVLIRTCALYSRSFFVELLCGPHSLLNIEFCFGSNRAIVLRSCSNDIDTNHSIEADNVLEAGMKFRLTIVVHNTYYDVLLNDSSIALFPHRYPPRLVQCLAISKFVNIHIIDLEGLTAKKGMTTRSMDDQPIESSLDQWNTPN
ncbi:hypothetical protein Y032_0094g2698 [Ancylostoma ceylanicum]|uniref:Galectin n=1 Tax=Ancylostoma ceylanicum TaxID=53326 RepID=A0A016TK09_9BILA|nr:hypothetical protein Y032_0094g2698 [Ancylostoma ceylanicum]